MVGVVQGILKIGWFVCAVFYLSSLIVSDKSYASVPSVNDFARAPQVENFSLSPSGKNLLFQKAVGKDRFFVISRINHSGLETTYQHLIDKDIHEAGAFWLSNDKIFGHDTRYIGKLPFREEEPWVSVWAMNSDGSNKKILWEEKPSRKKKRGRKGRRRKPVHAVSFQLLHFLPMEPNYVLLIRIEQTPEKRNSNELDIVSDIFRMNIDTGDMQQVTPDHGIANARMFSWVPDQTGVIRMGFGEIGKDDEPVILVRKDANSPWTRLHDNDLFKRGKFFPIVFGADPDILYVSSSHATGFSVIYRFSLKRGRLKGKVFGHQTANARELFFSKDHSRIQAISYYDDEYQLKILDEEFTQRLDKIKAAVDSKHVYFGQQDQAKKRQIIWTGDERSMGKPWLFFDDTGQAIELPEPAPWIKADDMAPMQSISYRARDGLEIPGYLTLPEDTAQNPNLPAIVLPHGGPYVRDYKDWNYWVQFLVSRGYAVLQPNFRGSSGHGSRYLSMGYGEWGDDMQQDVADGAKWLVSEGIADPDRICILGGSYGGYAALMGLVQDSDLFRCAVSFAPATDLKRLLKQDNMWDKDYAWYWRVTDGKSGRELKEISPVFQAKAITRPLLLMHGDQDDIVFIDQSRIMVKALNKRKNPAPFYYQEFAGLGHSLATAKSRRKFLREIEVFLNKYNPSDAHLGEERSKIMGVEK